ncbi:MAG TPA: GNAT family N-acetyltransferase [Aggregatilineaceae bacterium]|nr:GNAT family N-acetyltransferase [Aggregatilineaceae bacterium]
MQKMTTRKRSQFIVRELSSEKELQLCLELDHSYESDYVWQMDEREEGEDVTIRFRTVRLPRAMQVTYPRDSQELALAWKQRDCFLVATVDVDNLILGYIQMRVHGNQGWVADLVVGQPFRRRRIGSALLDQGIRWARLHQLQRISIEMQTKNYPAISFAKKQGFVFCGYNDHHYSNQDIALFFSKSVQ